MHRPDPAASNVGDCFAYNFFSVRCGLISIRQTKEGILNQQKQWGATIPPVQSTDAPPRTDGDVLTREQELSMRVGNFGGDRQLQ
jgi:hypothetical protein